MLGERNYKVIKDLEVVHDRVTEMLYKDAVDIWAKLKVRNCRESQVCTSGKGGKYVVPSESVYTSRIYDVPMTFYFVYWVVRKVMQVLELGVDLQYGFGR